jgi:hypothetical protein
VKHGVLKHIHPMIGLDFHVPWVPGTPAPAPSPVPYNTFSFMSGLLVTSKYTKTTFTEYFGLTMLQGTDIGPGIPHLGPPTLTWPFDLLGSSSKSYFAVSAVQADGKPVVASLAVVINPNLNCGTPLPAPLGIVLAMTTHRVDMSWADIMGGLATMACDFVLQALLNKLGGAIGDRIAGALRGPIMRRAFQSALFRNLMSEMPDAAARFAAHQSAALANRSMERLVGYGVGFFLGGPMGVDFAAVPVIGWTPGGAGASAVTTGQADGEGTGGVAGAGRAVGQYMDNAGVPSL